jgi:acyl carrier protein
MADSAPLTVIAEFIRRERPDVVGARIDPAASLIDGGVLDSMFLIQLVAFVEQQFAVSVAPEEVSPDNFESLERMDRLIRGKLAGGR